MSRRTAPFGQTGTAFFYLAAVLSLLLLAPIAQAAPLGERIGGVRIPFIANRGQTDSAVAYYAPTFAGTVYVTRKGEIVYSLPALAKDTGDSSGSPTTARGKTGGSGWTLTETAVGGSTRVTAEQRAVTQINYFIGNDPGRWRSGVDTYEGVGLGEVWPGVFLSLRAHGDNVEKLFTVRPGADPSRIRMRIAGAESLRINEAGALVVATRFGEVTFTRPVAYQEQDGVRRAARVAYRAQGRDYGFSVSGYDPALPVVIDPLLQATYLGGNTNDLGHALAIHPTSGEVYVTGVTTSPNFPGITGGAQPAFGGNADVFVARLNATLTTLIQATYLGGNFTDIGFALAIRPASGEVLVAGVSSSANFPGTTGGAQPAKGGGFYDVFVARLNTTLTTLIQATYLGGSGEDFHIDFGMALAIHPTSAEVYVAGFTDSNDFPGTTGGAQPARAGVLGDAFVARLNPTLTALLQATYLGGGVDEVVTALAIHPTSGEVFVAGATASSDFPGTTGGAQPAIGGGTPIPQDAFVARLNPTLTTLIQATYLGGSGSNEFGYSVAIHPSSGDVYVAGITGSTNFPGTAGGAQPSGGGDAFVARLNTTLTALIQATYLGGSGGEDGRAVIHPTSGDVYVAGQTSSTNFPGTTGGAQPVSGGGGDAFVAHLNATLTTLIQATYLGGSNTDRPGRGVDVAIHPTSGEVYVAGLTESNAVTGSNNFPGTTGGAQPASGGFGTDAFVARLTADLAGAAPPTMTNGPPPNGTVGLAYSFTYTSTGSPTFSVTVGSLPPGLSLSSAGVISGTPTTAGTFTGTVTASNGTAPNATENFSIIISPAPPSITNGLPPNGMVGVAYSFTYTSTGSPTFSVTVGSLPPGLSLSSAGVISGTPTTAGTFTGTVTASNGTAPNATQNFSITISPAAATAAPAAGPMLSLTALVVLAFMLAVSALFVLPRS